MKCRGKKLLIMMVIAGIIMFSLSNKTIVKAGQTVESNNVEEDKEISDISNNEGNVYKVGIFGFPKFIGEDESGELCGYAGEYLKKISEYTGVEFQCVYVPFDDALKTFIAGDFDIYAGAHQWKNSENSFDFSSQSIGTSYLELYALKEKNQYAFNDFEEFSGIRIGYMTDSIQHINEMEILKEKGVDAIFIPYEDCSYDYYKQSLCRDEVDAIVATTVRYEESYISIARLDCNEIYFGLNKDKPELKNIIDEAMKNIMFEDPTYEADLYDTFFGDNIVISQLLTGEEREYVENNPDLNVFFCNDCGYLSELYDDTYMGIQEDIIYSVAKKAGFNVNIVQPPKDVNIMDYAKDGYINLLTSNLHFNKSEDGFVATNPYLTVRYYLIENLNNKNTNDCKIAVSNDISILEDYIKAYFPNGNLVYYNNYKDCLNAVRDGKCDITFATNYIAEFYLKKYEYMTLSMTFIDFSYDLCFYIPDRCDPRMVQIISKCLGDITDMERQAIILKNVANIQGQNLMEEILYANPLMTSAAIIVFVGMLFIAIFTSLQSAYRNRQQQQLSIALEQANIAAKAKTEFLSRMSHDIRTPLNGIIGMTDISLGDDEISEATREHLNKINDAGSYLLGLINDVLDMSKIESGKVHLCEELVDRNKFLNSITELLKPSAYKYGITLNVDFSQTEAQCIVIDKLRTQQIYMNLLNNAIKFSPEGSVVEWIIKDNIISPTDMETTCIIRDKGCGMSEEFMKKMFEPFEQEDNIYRHRQNGTGLGLGIVKCLVELMGGTIDVESELGIGTTFTIKLFRKIGLEKEDKKCSDENMTICLAGKRILICEDNPLNVEIAEHFLQKVGIVYEVAENGYKGIAMFDASKPYYYDAILMDIRMPLCDGIEATKRIRRLEREDAAVIPIIAMSANAFEEDKRISKEAGMNEHLAKPVNSQTLYSVLWKYLGNK